MSKQWIASFKNREKRDKVTKFRNKCVTVSISIPIISKQLLVTIHNKLMTATNTKIEWFP